MKRRPPYLSSVLATGLVLSLLGVYALLLLQGRGLIRELRESTTVVIELTGDTSPAIAEAFGTWLRAQPYAREGGVQYVSKEEGARRLQEEFGEDFLAFDLDNPLYDLYTVQLREAFVEQAAIRRLREGIVEQPGVLATYVQEDVVNALARRVGTVAYVGFALGAALLLGCVFLIVNTAKLALLHKAHLIKNMELVGASWGFISRPFLRRAAQLGLVAGILAVGATTGVGAFAKTALPAAWQPVPLWHYAALAGALVAAGLAINYISTFFVVRRTLKLRDDDLAAL